MCKEVRYAMAWWTFDILVGYFFYDLTKLFTCKLNANKQSCIAVGLPFCVLTYHKLFHLAEQSSTLELLANRGLHSSHFIFHANPDSQTNNRWQRATFPAVKHDISLYLHFRIALQSQKLWTCACHAFIFFQKPVEVILIFVLDFFISFYTNIR